LPVALTTALATLLDLVSGVLSVRSLDKVPRVATATIVARVERARERELAVVKVVGDSMCLHHVLIQGELTVSRLVG
jgi:hypothetical protein